MKSTQKIWNVHAQRKDPTPGTQRNLYSTGLRLGFALGKTQILGFASGKTQKGFALAPKIPTCLYPQRKILALGALPNANPQRQVFCIAVEYRLKCQTGLWNNSMAEKVSSDRF